MLLGKCVCPRGLCHRRVDGAKKIQRVTGIGNTESNILGYSPAGAVKGQVLYPDQQKLQAQIDQLKVDLSSQSQVSEEMIALIGECLDEISEKIEGRKPVPRFFWKWLSRTADAGYLTEKIEALRLIIEAH